MTNTQHSHPFHAVKEAGVTDALKGAGKFLFDEHPLPTYKPTNPGQQTPNWFDKVNPFGTDKGVQKGYVPGRIGNFLAKLPGMSSWGTEVGPHSVISHPTAGYGEGFFNKAKTYGHFVGEFVREGTLGSPLAVDRQLRANTLGGVARNYGQMAKNLYGFGPGSSLRDAVLSLAPAAYSLHSVITGDKAHRGANVGATIGNLAVAPLTSRLGLTGVLLHAPVQAVGSWLGSKFDHEEAPSLPPDYTRAYRRTATAPQLYPKTASLIGSVAEAAKKHPVSAALAASATLHGANALVKLVKSTEDPRTVPTLPSRST